MRMKKERESGGKRTGRRGVEMVRQAGRGEERGVDTVN